MTDSTGFTIERTFDVPRETVWRLWTEPDEMARWWHPEGMTTPRDSVTADLRPGGRYTYTMVGPDGAEHPTGGVYREIDPPRRLVFTWGDPEGLTDASPVVTVELDADGDRTRMRFRLDGVSGAPGDGYFHDGWASAFAVLGATLSGMVS
ncbi:MAG: SRPBCC family protein [Dermatophilaceae bacterium]